MHWLCLPQLSYILDIFYVLCNQRDINDCLSFFLWDASPCLLSSDSILHFWVECFSTTFYIHLVYFSSFLSTVLLHCNLPFSFFFFFCCPCFLVDRLCLHDHFFTVLSSDSHCWESCFSLSLLCKFLIDHLFVMIVSRRKVLGKELLLSYFYSSFDTNRGQKWGRLTRTASHSHNVENYEQKIDRENMISKQSKWWTERSLLCYPYESLVMKMFSRHDDDSIG